jgi:hypothetical protein
VYGMVQVSNKYSWLYPTTRTEVYTPQEEGKKRCDELEEHNELRKITTKTGDDKVAGLEPGKLENVTVNQITNSSTTRLVSTSSVAPHVLGTDRARVSFIFFFFFDISSCCFVLSSVVVIITSVVVVVVVVVVIVAHFHACYLDLAGPFRIV